jgi:hypothetical protein
MTLEFVQRYFGGGQCRPPQCEMDCSSRAIALWQTPEKKAYDLCEKHRKELDAPEMTPGVWYAPTGLLCPGWKWIDGKPTLIPTINRTRQRLLTQENHNEATSR